MTILIFAVWLILNGRITLEITLFGIALCAVIYAFMHLALGYTPKTELAIFKVAPLLLVYIAVLIWEILRANFGVMKVILSSADKIRPAIIEIKLPIRRAILRVLLANSITLTPGTITVDISGDGRFLVHCLDRSMTDGIESSKFVKLIEKMEAVLGDA